MGGVLEVLAFPQKEKSALLVRNYPKGEMEEVLFTLSRYFAGYVLEK